MGTFVGKYDNLMALYQVEQVTSATGQRTNTFVEYVTEIPCNYQPKGGADTNENEQRVADNTFVFKIHYPHSFEVLETMEIEYEGCRFKIDNVRESAKGRKVELEITATKKDNQ
jgi:SPP1 family predicted phage head-tail adaptor